MWGSLERKNRLSSLVASGQLAVMDTPPPALQITCLLLAIQYTLPPPYRVPPPHTHTPAQRDDGAIAPPAALWPLILVLLLRALALLGG